MSEKLSDEKSAALAFAFATLDDKPSEANAVTVPGRKLQAGDHLVMVSDTMARIVGDDECN